jgi:hypothetical protein
LVGWWVIVMDDHAAQALKVAVARTLLVAGVGLLLAGAAVVGLGFFRASEGPGIAQGLVWACVGAVLTAFSQLVPPPTWHT